MFVWLKKLSGAFSNGMWLSGRPDLAPLDLDTDWADIDRLMTAEEWPFLRSDLELSHAQPHLGMAARKVGKFAGFFNTHSFGDVAYLDMMIIDKDFRNGSIARPLYFSTTRALKEKGATGFVAHATNDSGPLLGLLGYTPGISFTLLEREVKEMTVAGGHRGELVEDDEMTVDEIVTLDTEIMGVERPAWVQHLYDNPEVRLYGFRKKKRLTAALALRPRKGDAWGLDMAHGIEFADISSLVHVVLVMNSGKIIQVFARTDSKLHQMLTAIEFEVPAFFQPIGPLVEYRLGETGDIGTDPRVLTMNWL